MVSKKFLSLCAAAAAAFIAFSPTVPAEAGLSSEQAKEVWNRVATPTGLTSLPFYVKEDSTPNAWVTNGESVTVTTGILNLLDYEDELYAVFAHEAGHVKLNHIGKTQARSTGLTVASTLLSNLVGSDLAGAAFGVGANLINSGWSREQEIESDDYAVALAHQNGENPEGMYFAIYKLSQVNKTEPSGFNSHPPDDRRLTHIKNSILKVKPDATFSEEGRTSSGSGSSSGGSDNKPFDLSDLDGGSSQQ